MVLSYTFSENFNERVAASTAHIPPDTSDGGEPCLNGLAEVLSRTLRNMCKENDLYPDPSHVSFAACYDLLSRTPAATSVLIEHHRKKEYSSIFSHEYFRPPGLERPSHAPAHTDVACQSEVENILRGARDTLRAIADGSQTYETWTPRSEDRDHVDHIASLNIPQHQSRPLLVLHDIGRLIDEDILRERLVKIFRPGHDTFFVNASGSGKTRLIYEGLSQHWGFYLTAKVDSSRLGSGNVDFVTSTGLMLPNPMTILPDQTAPHYAALRDANMLILRRRYKDNLLSHALVMREFLRFARAAGLQAAHKARWLQCQLQAVVLSDQDPFYAITSALLVASDEYVERTLGEVLAGIREQLDGAQLHVALDEAQALGFGDFGDKARYGLPSFDTRPYLRQLVLAWRGRPGLSLVVTGTELPKDLFDQEPLEMEYGNYRWCSATGAFHGRDSNRDYLLRYLPTTFVKKRSGEQFLQRAGLWLRGRHRLTASFIAIYIRFGLAQPHQQLNDYVQNSTGYLPKDAEEFTVDEGERFERAKRVLGPFSPYDIRRPFLKSTVHRSLFNLFVRPSSVLQYDYSHVDVVTQALGHFIDDDACRIAIDEPFLLVRCAQWFISTSTDLLDLAYLRRLTQHPGHVAEFRSEVAAYVLARRLELKPDLRQIFSFVGAPPSWASARTTSLLLLHNTASGRRSARAYFYAQEIASATPVSTTTTVSAEAEITRWLEHTNVSPFCIIRHPSSSTLLFTVKLSSDRNLWVLLDGEPGDELSSTDFTERMSRMDPCSNFSVEQLDLMRNIPNPSQRAGDPPFFFALASRTGDSQACDASGRVIATVDLAELSKKMELSSDELMRCVLHFVLPDAGVPSVETGKRVIATDPSSAGSTRASKRRISMRASENRAGRTLRASTVQQRRSPTMRTTR